MTEARGYNLNFINKAIEVTIYRICQIFTLDIHLLFNFSKSETVGYSREIVNGWRENY